MNEMNPLYTTDILKRLQAAELAILDVVAQICAEHDIEWFLDSGSALGAIRHGGFIPWDDDIDIGMRRSDYDRFLAIAPSALPDNLVLHTPQTTENYAATFSKICKKGTRFATQETIDAGFDQGIFIDIFPYDPLSRHNGQKRHQLSNALKYTRMLYLYHSPNVAYPTRGPMGFLLRIGFHAAHVVLKACTNSKRLHEAYQVKTRCPVGSESNQSAVLPYAIIGEIDTAVISSTITVDFEGRDYPVPKEYSKYLEWLYGPTWRELPPPELRKTHAPVVLDFGDRRNVLETRKI